MIPKVHIIAEAGTNHNGELKIAKRLIDVAVDASADSVKFQMISPEELYLPQFFENGRYTKNSVYEKRAAKILSDNDYRLLSQYCSAKGILFNASVFGPSSLNLVDELNVSYIKIASCDLNNSRLLIRAAECGRKLIISTGMASLKEIEHAVSDIEATGNTDIVLMHCVSMYPCPTEQTNLSFINVLKHEFGLPVGFSDHTENSLAGAIAISMGAEWLEKHYTLDRNADGFDHAYAMEPNSLVQFVKNMRSITEACFKPIAKVQPDEIETRNRARRSLYAARDIQAGEVLSEEDILTVRPQGPLDPNDIFSIKGRHAGRLIHQYEPLSLDQFQGGT
jgi:N,N'-diacetyllegionaminate synthase